MWNATTQRDRCSFFLFFRVAHQPRTNNNCTKYKMECKILWFWVLRDSSLCSLLLPLDWEDVSVCRSRWNEKSFLEAVSLRPALPSTSLCPALHSPRLPLLPSDLTWLAPWSQYKLLEKQIRPLPGIFMAWLNHYQISLVEEHYHCDSISYSKAN